MKPVSLLLQGFRSWEHPSTFSFGRDTGLHSIQGDNQYQPSLGSNSSGKSSIVHAWCWVLFGKTLDGGRAGDLHTRGSSIKTEVEYTFTDTSGRTRVIKRTWSPNKLLLDSEPVEQEAVEQVTGFDFVTFTYGVTLGQFSSHFFDMKPTEALDLLTRIHGLERWDNYAAEATHVVKDLEQALSTVERHITRAEGTLASIDVGHYQDLVTTYEATRERRASDAADAIDIAREARVRAQDDVVQADKPQRGFTPPSRPSDTPTREATAAKDAASREVQALTWKADAEIDKIEALDKLEATCPHCHQVVSDEHVEALVQPLEDCVEQLEVQVTAAKETAAAAETRVAEARLAHREATRIYDQEVQQIHAKARAYDKLEAALARTEADLSRLIEAHAVIIQAANPQQEQLLREERRLEETTTYLKEIRGEAQTAEARVQSSKYWIRGFRDIKLMLTGDMLTTLEIEVNKALGALGMIGWSVELSVEQETKSKSVSRGFRVLARAPGSDTVVPFSTLSGGEATRLRIAGTLGIMCMIQSGTAQCDTIVLDEPSTHLNLKGVADLLETLTQYAADHEKRILIIDHVLPDYPYAHVTQVVRGEGGSVIGEVS